MRVLHVHNLWPVTGDLVNGLRALGVEAEIFEPTLGVGQKGKFRKALLPLIRTREAFQLWQLVKSKRFDVVHVHYARHAYMTLITGLPYYLHCHGSDIRRDLRRPGFRELTRLAIRRAIKVFYATPDLGDYIRPIRQDTVFLPNPINLDDFVVLPNDRPSTLRIFSISKLDRFKGVEQIIQAIELIWQSRPETEVALFNFGNQIIRAGRFFEAYRGDRRLILLSPVPHQQMIRLIQSSDVVLGQQDLQVGALGVSELESMACGKPVVCYFKYPNAYPEPPPVLVSQTPEEASEHVVRLLDDPALAQSVGRQSREWVATYHEQKHIARRLLQYYQA
jgi:glycosyltransferase involved in cell wall biosynthesis